MADRKKWSPEELEKIKIWEAKATQLSETLTLTGIWPEGSEELKAYKKIATYDTVLVGEVTEDGTPTGKTKEVSSAEFRYSMALMSAFGNNETLKIFADSEKLNQATQNLQAQIGIIDEHTRKIDAALASGKLKDEQKKILLDIKTKEAQQKQQALGQTARLQAPTPEAQAKIKDAEALLYQELYDRRTEPQTSDPDYRDRIVKSAEKLKTAAKIVTGAIIAPDSPPVMPVNAKDKPLKQSSILPALPKTLDALDRLDAILDKQADPKITPDMLTALLVHADAQLDAAMNGNRENVGDKFGLPFNKPAKAKSKTPVPA